MEKNEREIKNKNMGRALWEKSGEVNGVRASRTRGEIVGGGGRSGRCRRRVGHATRWNHVHSTGESRVLSTRKLCKARDGGLCAQCPSRL